MDDLGLLERTKQGDEDAFASLFERHKAAVYRYASHMGGAADADDVVQEAFLALLRQLAQYDATRGSLQGYLLGIARRLTLKRLGRVRWEESIDPADAAMVARDADAFEDLSRAETVERVRAAIALLPVVFREAIVLCELNELDYATAAAVMDCPIGTVRSRLHRARAQLCKVLEEREVNVHG